ncbi:MAG: hypothetical protein KDE27_13250 [Planctomycetes bacterium]|nr:hypothetical protein [Planctomycetota bacterium]
MTDQVLRRRAASIRASRLLPTRNLLRRSDPRCAPLRARRWTAARSAIAFLVALGLGPTALTPAALAQDASTQNPGGQNPGGQNPGGQNPGGQNPGGQNPGGQNPGGQNPGGQNPGETQLPGQDPQDPQGLMRIDPNTNEVVVSMSENNGLELPEFIKWAQLVTHRAFTYDDGEIRNQASGGGRVTFLGSLRFKRENFERDFFSFFQTMLYIKGFAIVPRGEGDLEILEIISTSGPRVREVTNGARYVTPEQLVEYKSQTGVPILTTVQLKHINATVANNALRPFFASTGSPNTAGGVTLGNVGNNTAMLLQGYGPQVYAAVQLLELVDVEIPPPNLVVQNVQLVHAAPEEIEPILTEVLESRSRIRQQVLAENAQGGGAAVSAGAQPQLKVVVNSSQKALVLSGIQDHVDEALELIAQLDLPTQIGEGQASVIYLKNVLAEELRQTLNQFMQDDNNAEQQAQQAQAGAGQVRRARRTVIQAHKESNSLLVSAAPTKFLQIQTLIDRLDVRQPQVLIECALVELTTGDLDRFGIELGLLDLPNDPNQDYNRGFGFTDFGQSVFQDTDDDGLPDTRLPDFENIAQGITGGIISGKGFAVPVLINALSTDDSANILSLPSVLVNNNETAIVSTEESRPTLQSNASTATTTTAAGEPRNAGITLEISPTISPNHYLRLNINLEVSRFVGAFDPNSATGGGVTLRRTIKTQVTMPTESTMVLGGVIEDSESTSDGGVPFLKDIPILGYLFKKYESMSNKTNLYFFVTPTILDEDDFQDLWHMSLNKKLEAQNYIGERRLRIIDKRWTGSTGDQARRLEDEGATVEDLDAQSGFEMPLYDRGRQPANMPIAPGAPQPGTTENPKR